NGSTQSAARRQAPRSSPFIQFDEEWITSLRSLSSGALFARPVGSSRKRQFEHSIGCVRTGLRGSGALNFVERHGLWSEEQKDAALRLKSIVEEQKLEVIRLSFPDQHGILRGKTLIASEAIASLESGCSITTTLLAKDTAHRSVFPVFSSGGGFGMKEMEGAADALMVADPTTFRVLPWSSATGWVLCDLYFNDGRPVPFATRGLYARVLDQLAKRGYDFVAGL